MGSDVASADGIGGGSVEGLVGETVGPVCNEFTGYI